MSDVSPERTEKERNEKTDPGASRHGNFMNYYQFHPAEERVRQLPRGVWRSSHPDRKYVGLDVGCNAGDLTCKLYEFLEKTVRGGQADVSLLGVDLDPTLIDRAREQNYHPDRVTFERLDFMSEDCERILREYLDRLQRSRFDVAFCFSITMWIHLNHGDEGLTRFLRRVCSTAEMVIIEPQPWKCYRNASRRLRRAKAEDFPLLKTLNTHDPVLHIDTTLKDLCHFRKLAVTADNEWGRKLLIYERNNDPSPL